MVHAWPEPLQDALKAAAAGKGADAVAEPAVAGTAVGGEPQLQPAQRRSGGGAAAPAAAPRHPSAHVLPPSALAPGIHPPGRRYFHCRSAVPGLAAEMFGPYDSDDDTDDEEWEVRAARAQRGGACGLLRDGDRPNRRTAHTFACVLP